MSAGAGTAMFTMHTSTELSIRGTGVVLSKCGSRDRDPGWSIGIET